MPSSCALFIFHASYAKLLRTLPFTSVADPGCLSRILIFVHPGSWIPDPKTATKERDEKKFVVLPFSVATKITLKIILILNW
jgi:hypothetical protein